MTDIYLNKYLFYMVVRSNKKT